MSLETLHLTRNDLLQTSAARKKTLVVFPSGANKQQKMGSGDLGGVIQCFSIKKGECDTSFKSLPTRHRITALALGKGKSQKDKLFFAEDAIIKGFTKKGREFFRFDTNMTESISNMVIVDNQLYIMGEYTVVSFLSHKERGTFLSPDRINDSDGVLIEDKLLIALACQDRIIRVVDGASVIMQCRIQGIPVSIIHTSDSHDQYNRHPQAIEVLFGTESGELGQVLIDSDGMHSYKLLERKQNQGSIVAIFAEIDFSKDGMTDIAVGRDDGHLEIYSLDESGVFCEIFKTKLPERINTISGGFITSPVHQDLLVQTYAGKIIAYCPDGSGLFVCSASERSGTIQGSQISAIERSERLEKKIQELHGQLNTLSMEVTDKREVSRHLIGLHALVHGLDIKHHCRYNDIEDCFALTIELERPLFCVGLSCDVRIKLLEAQNSVAIMSRSSSDSVKEYPILATYRCQDSTNKLDIRYRCEEGLSGCITCFLIPKMTPRIAFTVCHKILPLCMHERISEIPQNFDAKCNLHIKGQCTDEEFCLLFAKVLPNFPKQWPNSDDGPMFYLHRNSKSLMSIEKQGTELSVVGEDFCSLEILRSSLDQEAVSRHLNISSQLKVEKEYILEAARELWMQLENCKAIKRKVVLVRTVLTISEQEVDISFLDEELAVIHRESSQLLANEKENEERMEKLYDRICIVVLKGRKLLGLHGSQLFQDNLLRYLKKQESSFEGMLEYLTI